MKQVATADLIAAYRQGAGLKTLAKRYPLSRSAILYRLRRAGVVMRAERRADGEYECTPR